jgi:hypothetical protein
MLAAMLYLVQTRIRSPEPICLIYIAYIVIVVVYKLQNWKVLF